MPPDGTPAVRTEQAGDQHFGAVAGGDIHQGVDPALVLRHLDGERQSRDAMAAMLERLWGRIDTMERDRRQDAEDAALERGIDFEARLKRQQQMDVRFDALERRLWWLLGLVAVLVTVVAVLVLREAGVLAARAVWDVAIVRLPGPR